MHFPPKAGGSYTVEANTNCHSGNLASFDLSPVAKCQYHCSTLSHCAFGLLWTDGKCYIKGSCPYPKKVVGATTIAKNACPSPPGECSIATFVYNMAQPLPGDSTNRS